MGHGAGVRAAERLQFSVGKPDDDLIPDGNDLEQIHFVLLCPCTLRCGKSQGRQGDTCCKLSAGKHLVVLKSRDACEAMARSSSFPELHEPEPHDAFVASAR